MVILMFYFGFSSQTTLNKEDIKWPGNTGRGLFVLT